MDHQVWLEYSLDYLGVQRVKLKGSECVKQAHPQPAWCAESIFVFLFLKDLLHTCVHICLRVYVHHQQLRVGGRVEHAGTNRCQGSEGIDPFSWNWE